MGFGNFMRMRYLTIVRCRVLVHIQLALFIRFLDFVSLLFEISLLIFNVKFHHKYVATKF